jgi:hypothetical protein
VVDGDVVDVSGGAAAGDRSFVAGVVAGSAVLCGPAVGDCGDSVVAVARDDASSVDDTPGAVEVVGALAPPPAVGGASAAAAVNDETLIATVNVRANPVSREGRFMIAVDL